MVRQPYGAWMAQVARNLTDGMGRVSDRQAVPASWPVRRKWICSVSEPRELCAALTSGADVQPGVLLHSGVLEGLA